MESLYTPKIWKKQDTILVNLPYNDFDQNASAHFKEMIEILIAKQTFYSLILDFSNVLLVDSTGYAAIVQAFNLCASKDLKLLLCSLKENIVETINKKGLNTMLEVYDNVHSALDIATNYSYVRQQQEKTLKGMQSIFGDPFEERVEYQ